MKHICPKCSCDRWKTKVKHKQWQCRKCGYIKTKGDK